MAHVLRETRIVERSNDESDTVTEAGSFGGAVARIIYFVSGIIMALLGLRFVLALLGANPANPFADFIYTTSHPFVAPFFGLFNYQSIYGVSRFELETLIAIVVYAILAWGIVRMVLALTNSPEDI